MKNKIPNINHETVIFTKHARERMELRSIGEDMIIQVMRKPDKTYNVEDGKIKFIGKSMGAKIHAICKPVPEQNRWIVITLWVRGENDDGTFVDRKSYNRRGKSSFSSLYNGIFFIIILIVLIFYYVTQIQ